MPLYEYECRACGKRFETMQRMNEPPLTTCPECGGEVKKLLSAPAFQFKGSGWYVTDYGGKGKEGGKEGKEGGKEGKEEAEPKPAAAGKTEGAGGDKAETKGGGKQERTGKKGGEE